MTRFLLQIAMALGLTVALTAGAAATDCELEPPTPITPIGCSSLTPMCVCDIGAESCGWQFRCVRYGELDPAAGGGLATVPAGTARRPLAQDRRNLRDLRINFHLDRVR